MFRILVLLAILTVTAASTAYAGFQEGYDAYKKKDWPVAILHLRTATEGGDARAMVVLGNMYLDGLGVAQDKHEAFNLYRRAAIRNNLDAMVMLGAMYQQGIGTDKNQRYAAGWFGRSARLGHASGAFFYAMHLYRGNRGRVENNYSTAFKPDHDAAYKWFRISALRTVNEKLKDKSNRLADGLGEKLGGEKVSALDKEVKDWIPEAPDTLGPLPEDIPPEQVKPDDFPPEVKKEEAAPKTEPEKTVPEVKP